MIKQLFETKVSKFLLAYYLLLVGFWSWINFQGLTEGPINNLYGLSYVLISLVGATYGMFVIAKKYGGFKSVVGKGISFLSLGLYALSFGQLVWSLYVMVLQIEVPYPSIADLGYFSIIPAYILAMYYFAKASGVHVSLRNYKGKIQAVLIPAILLTVVYALYLRDLGFDLSDPLVTFLDWVTPALYAVALSIGILTYNLSRGILGGRMKNKVLFLIFALLLEDLAEFSFFYRAGTETYYNAGPVDLLFTTAVFVMSLGILLFHNTET